MPAEFGRRLRKQLIGPEETLSGRPTNALSCLRFGLLTRRKKIPQTAVSKMLSLAAHTIALAEKHKKRVQSLHQ
jgi:hypothetical protein